LSSVGDAYLYLREPEMARDIYLEVLKSDPKNYNVRRQLFYAYIECDQYNKAYKVIDELAAEQPRYVKDIAKNKMMLNSRFDSTRLTAGAARLYAGEVKEADKIITPVAMETLDQAESREALGNLYMAHSWPRKAREQYVIGTTLPPEGNIGNQIGVANTDLALQNFKAAETHANALYDRDPEHLGVRRLKRDLEIHNMAELRVKVDYAFDPMSSMPVTGGEGYGIDTVLYSSPIDYNWRVYGGEYFAHQNEPNNEGSIGLSRTTVGAEYRGGPIIASLGPTISLYKGSQRYGVAGEVTGFINDNWTVAGSADSFSRYTPLRALNSGVRASFFNANAVWKQDESRSVRFGGMIMPFSDGNVRTGLSADYTEQLYVDPHFKFDGMVSAGESQNTADANRLYYNPGRDVIGLIGGRATHTLYQRYSTLYQHSLTVLPGFYWQERFGTDAAVRVRYEHRVRFNNRTEAGVGVNYLRQSYDGNPEDNVSLMFELVQRF
jgi:biofilm PGA synthesis protein PgaA